MSTRTHATGSTRTKRFSSCVGFTSVCPALVKLLVDRGYLGQITLSVDAGFWPEVSLRLGVGDPKRTYRCVFTHLVPMLKKLGITPDQIQQMLVANPRRHLDLK